MAGAWEDIQALKSKTSSYRAKLEARKREREGLAAEISQATSSVPLKTLCPSTGEGSQCDTSKNVSPTPKAAPVIVKTEPIKHDPEVENQLLIVLQELDVDAKCDSDFVTDKTSKALGRNVKKDLVENLLQKFAAQQMIVLSISESKIHLAMKIVIHSVDLAKISAFTNELNDVNDIKRKRDKTDEAEPDQPVSKQAKVSSRVEPSISVESLLAAQTAKERESKKFTEEIQQLLSIPTAKEQSLMERFRSQGGAQLQEFCQFGTKEECIKLGQNTAPCAKLHFRKIIHKHTDESLGDCSFLNTCFHMDTCKYVHYQIDYPEETLKKKEMQLAMPKAMEGGDTTYMFPPQWIQCDIRILDMDILGKCAVIMADPPWDIHMELPYGTMSDDEMRKMPVPLMQDDGYIFLWVTGRAMELGRECLTLWGYKRIDEIIWVKTNQLQRIIRTGRTGHWLNHGKEHCLVGVKGNPKGVNKGLDCDVIVAEVRATSHKPDEIYGIIERLSPGTRKVELFGRPHNVQPNWITLGNQLEGVRLVDPEIVKRFKEKYPDGNCLEAPKDKFNNR